MNAPQVVLLVAMTLLFGVALAAHGQPIERGRYNVGYVIVLLIVLNAILLWGGWYR